MASGWLWLGPMSGWRGDPAGAAVGLHGLDEYAEIIPAW